jgi:hypothetical protein
MGPYTAVRNICTNTSQTILLLYPELKLDEYGWNEEKDNGICRMSINGSKDMKQKVVDYFNKQATQNLCGLFINANDIVCGIAMSVYI